MGKRKSFMPAASAISIILAVGALTTAVTYSALQSLPSVLASNNITSATASMSISTDGTSFNNTKTGYNFSNVVPGGSAVPTAGNPVYVKNGGTSNLAIKASISSTPNNTNNVDLTKVYLHITKTDNSFDQSFPIKSLMDAYASGGIAIGDTVNASATTEYLMRVSMTADAFSGGSSVSISGVDLVFAGTAN